MDLVSSDVVLKADPSTLTERAFQWVTLKFSGVKNPSSNDWIGVFSPAEVQLNETSPIKYQYASHAPNYMSTGNGTLKFLLINSHTPYLFALFQNGLENPHLAGKSNIVQFSNENEAVQVHLTLTKSPNEIRVMWNGNSEDSSQHEVKWGTQSGIYPFNIQSESSTYSQYDMCGEPATTLGWKDPGKLHEAVLKHLKPGQTYYYIVGSNNAGWSPEFTFKAPPSVAPSSGVKLVAFGDMGKGERDGSEEHWNESPSLNTTDQIIAIIDDIDLVLHIGDISYAVGYSAQWDEFFDQIEPVASKVPYLTCIGNHERDFPESGSYYDGRDSGGECGIPYEKRLRMPTPAQDQPWYSVNYGNIHFVFMSTEHDFREGSIQRAFLEKDLAKVDRNATPWIIFSGHRPMYIDSTNTEGPSGDQPVARLLRESLEELLLKYSVNLALWGHHHSYQRTCPVFKERCQGSTDPSYPVHVVIGMAGMGLSQNIEDKLPVWSVVINDQEYGYTRIFTNETSFHFQFYSNSKGLLDEFWMHQ